jgi:NitT/TauT family transport system ATP-binding protein
MSSITIKDLQVSYPTSTGDEVVIDNLSLEIQDKKFICFLGPSGCGKTTLLNSIAGVVKHSGTIDISGANTNSHARIGYVFETPRLMNWLSVEENVAFPLLRAKTKKNEVSQTVDHYLDVVGISHRKTEHPIKCSEGERARVNIARALAVKPDIILMDEPFSHLDELNAKKLRELLIDIWQKEKNTILFVTHNAMEAICLADRICLLSQKPTVVREEIPVELRRPRELKDILDLYVEVLHKIDQEKGARGNEA